MVSVPSSDSLQRIHHLEKFSRFPEQLANLFDGKEFRDATQSLRGERLAMLVDDLDRVYSHDNLSLLPAYSHIASRHSRPHWPCLSEVPTRTQKGMRYLGNTTKIVHDFKLSFEHPSLASHLWRLCRCVRRNTQRFEGLR